MINPPINKFISRKKHINSIKGISSGGGRTTGKESVNRYFINECIYIPDIRLRRGR